MIYVYDNETRERISDSDELMLRAGLDTRMGYEAVALQDDGQIIICDKCGNFGYLDSNRYSAGLFLSDLL